MKILANDKNTIVFFSNDCFDQKLLILKINQRFQLQGYYNVIVYIDKNKGSVYEFEKENFEFFEPAELELNIIKKEDNFIYEFEDYNYIDKDVYRYKNKFYTDKFNLKQIEFTKILYGKKALEIKERWEKI